MHKEEKKSVALDAYLTAVIAAMCLSKLSTFCRFEKQLHNKRKLLQFAHHYHDHSRCRHHYLMQISDKSLPPPGVFLFVCFFLLSRYSQT